MTTRAYCDTAGTVTVKAPVAWPVEPLLSVPLILMVKVPVWLYECVSEVAVPDRTSGVVPSPQLTLTETIEPSASVEEKATVTVTPVLAGLGDTPEIVTAGDRSFTVSVLVPDPGPPLLVAVTVIMNV